MNQNICNLPKNHGGPIHYLGNRFLSLPDLSGHMRPDNRWLNEIFSIILTNTKGQKFNRCFEPFAGSASWSLAAMELKLADEYVINDSDEMLINTHRLIRDEPEKVKEIYKILLMDYTKTSSKKDFFLETIRNYNSAKEDDQKSLLLPFIINHSWSGILFHDQEGNIVYRDRNSEGKIVPGYLDKANLSLDMYQKEIDRVSGLFNTNKVIFKSGDFQQVISDAKHDDFIALNPPYPENKNAQSDNTGMYVELYSHETLYEKLVYSIQELENKGVHYFTTYGFYNPKMKNFIIRDDSNQLRHYFRILGYKNCAFGIALDQMYFSSKFLIPNYLKSTIIPASNVLDDQEMTIEEAMKNFQRLQNSL